ncbi:hypothetical protein [Curtobacterium sp. MCSS17_016]|uniref:hypothetical protein n=1 Tax=Curtobacterium sp. MCSS17_016 TaxID=2175644 RepID=UPI000DA7244D|nr:hypothetical protein [Curtobacterium sp. MCSS17_016]WIE80993.1 hypothetical protein DEJ19_020975 [Curtobacterium sp. MCSS17_016]
MTTTPYTVAVSDDESTATISFTGTATAAADGRITVTDTMPAEQFAELRSAINSVVLTDDADPIPDHMYPGYWKDRALAATEEVLRLRGLLLGGPTVDGAIALHEATAHYVNTAAQFRVNKDIAASDFTAGWRAHEAHAAVVTS